MGYSLEFFDTVSVKNEAISLNATNYPAACDEAIQWMKKMKNGNTGTFKVFAFAHDLSAMSTLMGEGRWKNGDVDFDSK